YERGRRDQPRGRARATVARRGAGDERRRRAHGGDLADHAKQPARRPRLRKGRAVTERVIIRGGLVIDPATRFDAIADVLVEDGRVAAVRTDIDAVEAREIDARRLIVTPGFVDLHTHLRDPGLEYKEDLESGTRAAARGGFTTVCAMPNTEPAMDSRS